MKRTDLYYVEWYPEETNSYGVSFLDINGYRKTAIWTIDGHLIVVFAAAITCCV